MNAIVKIRAIADSWAVYLSNSAQGVADVVTNLQTFEVDDLGLAQSYAHSLSEANDCAVAYN